MSGVLNEAVKADVSDRVMGAMVSMAAGAFPSSAPAVASAAVRSYGSNIREGHVRNVIAPAFLPSLTRMRPWLPFRKRLKRFWVILR